MDASLLDPRVHSLLDRLLDMPVEARSDFLDQACAGEPEVRATLERLLAASTGPDSSLSPGGALNGPLWAALDHEAPKGDAIVDQNIGAYRLLKNIGSGGMSTVYLAERADGVFEHRVAFKLLRAGARDEAGLRRFDQERQVLASLNHPNIARLLDGGITDDGVPYLVMEYVDGKPIDEYCASHDLRTQHVLRLLQKVSEAVAYAHRNLVLHRDIKPSNVLVTERGDVKLLDFGIAKTIDQSEPESGDLTLTALRPMTPRFASPEQISGAPMTTASDVYQLGCLMYRLLSGQSPHGGDSTSQAELIDTIRSVTPEPPSHVAGRSKLRGDLDTICLKALSKAPDRRYATAREFIDDLQRHMDAEPISARRDSALYRLHRFVKRNALAVTTAAVVLGVVIVQTLYYTNRLTAARDAARLEADKAGEVSLFLSDVFAETDPDKAQGDPMTARELLDRGVARIEQDLADQPDTQAHLYLTMGRTYSARGLFDAAEHLLARSVSMRRKLHDAPHADLYESLEKLGILHWRQGRYEEAEARLREACEIAAELFGADESRTLGCQSNLGNAIYRQTRFDEAQVIHERVVEKTRAVMGESDPGMGKRLNNLANVYWMQGHYERAATAYSDALRINTQQNGRKHPSSLDALNNLAMTRSAQGRDAEAATLFEDVIELRREVLGEDHPRTLGSMMNLAEVYARTGRVSEYIDQLRDVLERRTRVLGVDHHDRLISMRTLAEALILDGQLEAAKPYVDEALDRHSATLGPEHYDSLLDLRTLGEWHLAGRNPADALVALESAATGLERVVGAGHTATLLARVRMVQALVDLSDLPAAGMLCETMLDAIETADDITPWVRGQVLAEWGRWLALNDRRAEAADILEQSRRLLAPAVEQGDPDATAAIAYQALLQ